MANSNCNERFEMPAALAQCNDFEKAICRTVFQDRYSETVKACHVIDHLTSRGEELDLIQSGTYVSAIRALKEFRTYHSGLIKGFVGERHAFKAARHAIGEESILTNIELEAYGEHNEYDQILITPQALIIVEVKNYSAPTTLGEDGVLRFDDGRPGACNVGEKMSSKRYVLERLASGALGRSITESMIRCILVNANIEEQIRDEFGEIEICGIGTLPYRLGRLVKERAVFGEEELAALKEAILAGHSPVEAEPAIDFEHISSLLHEALSMIEEAAEEEARKEELEGRSETRPRKQYREGCGVREKDAAAKTGLVIGGFIIGALCGYLFGKSA